MIMMISIHLKNDSIRNHLQNDDSHFDFKSIFKARFRFEIILKIILPSTA